MYNRVNIQSLPKSLQHFSKGEALEDAASLASFLEITVACAIREDFTNEEIHGLRLVFSLLHDKLAIARDEFKFPLASSKRDDPDLWPPCNKRGGDDE